MILTNHDCYNSRIKGTLKLIPGAGCSCGE